MRSRALPLAIVSLLALAACEKPKSSAEKQGVGRGGGVDQKPDGSPDSFAAKLAHHSGVVTVVRSARGSRFALLQYLPKQSDSVRSVILEKKPDGVIIERYNSDEDGLIVDFDVNETSFCLLRSALVEVKDETTDQKAADVSIQCEGIAAGRPVLFHDDKIASEARFYSKTGRWVQYDSPDPARTLLPGIDLLQPYARLRLDGDDRVLLLAGYFGERLYRIAADPKDSWHRELRPFTEIFLEKGVPRSVPRLAVDGGRIVVVGGVVRAEKRILDLHYKNQRQIPFSGGDRLALLVSGWDVQGNLQWQQAIATPDALEPADVNVGKDGINLLARLGERGRSSWVSRLGFDGSSRWRRELSSKTMITRMHALAESGELIVGGSCRGNEGDEGVAVSGTQGCLFRFNPENGTINVTKEFGGGRNDGILALAPIEGGRVMIGGFANGPVGRAKDERDSAQNFFWGTW